MEMWISCDDMYPFGNVSTHSVETSSKIQSYLPEKIKIKIKSEQKLLLVENLNQIWIAFHPEKMRDAPVFANFMTQWLVTVLTHFSPVFHFYAPRKQRF